ncbi:MAG: addiction module HigA family antidote [Cyclobacteriaceae bacterium]
MIITKSNDIEKLPNVHLGEVLFEEFLKPLGITAYRLSKGIGIAQTRISQILKKNRRMTTDTAIRLSQYFGTTPKFWLGLQDDFDIEEESTSKAAEFAAMELIK